MTVTKRNVQKIDSFAANKEPSSSEVQENRESNENKDLIVTLTSRNKRQSTTVEPQFADESRIQQLIQLDGPQHDCVLLRNNSGALKDASGRVVRFGLGNVSEKQNEMMKSSDLIGITSVTITPEMVGQKVAVFTAIEVKRRDWVPTNTKREWAQLNFINWVLAQGGIAGFASSVESFRRILGK